MLSKILLCVVSVLTAVASIAAEAPPDEFALTPEEREIVELTNKEREKAGLPILKANPTLTQLAREHSKAMASAEKLAHTLNSKTFVQRLQETDYKALAVGENVAWNPSNPADLVNSLMQSPGHRANILNKYFTDIGVGAARDASGHPYFTQDFARPVKAGATAIAQFSISNHTSQTATVSIPNQPSQAELEPGSTITIHVEGVGQLPKVKINVGKEDRELSFQDRGAYVIKQDKDRIEVTSAGSGENEATPAGVEKEPAR